MATLKLAVVPAIVLKNGKHKIRIAVSHNQDTRYIVQRFEIDNLKQFKTGKFYIDSCENISVRLQRRNVGATLSTKSGRPWKIVHSEEFLSRTEAFKREHEIKRKKSRKYIEYLISNPVGRASR